MNTATKKLFSYIVFFDKVCSERAAILCQNYYCSIPNVLNILDVVEKQNERHERQEMDGKTLYFYEKKMFSKIVNIYFPFYLQILFCDCCSDQVLKAEIFDISTLSRIVNLCHGFEQTNELEHIVRSKRLPFH